MNNNLKDIFVKTSKNNLWFFSELVNVRFSLINDNYRSRYLVVINHVVNTEALYTDHIVSIYKIKTCRFKEPFLSFQPKNIFIGKSRVCRMTEESGALNRGQYDGNSILLEMSSPLECNSLYVTSSECNEYCFGETIQTEFEFIFLSGYEIVKFCTEDKIIDFISNIGNNMVLVYAIAVGENYTYFLSDHYNFIEHEGIEERTLLNSTNDSVDPCDYHVLKCEIAFTELDYEQIHTLHR